MRRPPCSAFICAVIVAFLLLLGESRAATTLLPNGKQCFQATTGVNGMIGVLGTITGGSGYVNGTNVPLTGGSGTGATANITVSGGAVTSLGVVNPGKNYAIGDLLSASGGTGFSVPVNSISINSSLAGGSVNMWVPGQTTPKNTWQDSGQVTLNTNPIILDANGCAVIYGTGQYRQQLLDSLGNLVWDQLTTDTSAFNAVFWAGVAGGTPNAITVTDVGFNGTDGSVINFTALSSNTAATTLNPSGFGATPILKNTTGGLVALTAGDIIATNVASVIYKASASAFVLLNTVIPSAASAQAPLCGASGLKIINSGAGLSGNLVNITANSLSMVSAGGLTINRSNVSLVLNTTLGNNPIGSTANGMDNETPANSAWIDIFAIDNGPGGAPASLGSLAAGNGLGPNLPSGYVYKCYLGAMFNNSTGFLLGSLQLGNRAQFLVGGSGIVTPASLIIANNSGGGFGTYSPLSPVLASLSLANWVPPTATEAKVAITGDWKGSATDSVLLAPNTSWGGTNNGPSGSNGAAWPCWIMGTSLACTLVLETPQTLAWATTANAHAAVGAIGWVDAVNAN